MRILVRGAWAIACAIGLAATAGSCGDDDASPGGFVLGDGGVPDGGFDGSNPVEQRPLPFNPAELPTDGVDRTGVLGKAVVVAEVGKPVDGPSWHVADQALYFTVPGATPSLRRLLTDGGVEDVAFDGGANGTATGGADDLIVTERGALTTLQVNGGSAVEVRRRTGTFELLGDVAAEAVPDASTVAFFVDTGGARAYRYEPGAAQELTRVLDLDGDGGSGYRATAIAVGRNDLDVRVVYVGLGTGSTGFVQQIVDGPSVAADGGRWTQIPGISPNGIAVDEVGRILVAWARGIDVFDPTTGERIGQSPGLPLAAAPTNLAFGGPDRKTLFVTTAKGTIYAVKANIAGFLK